MSVTGFNEKLNALLSKDSIEKDDFLGFLKTLSALSKGIQDVQKLSIYGPVVKDWISAFQKIFGKHKTDQEVNRYMNKLFTTVTGVYLKLSQIFHQYERDYTQQFYSEWKQIISVMKVSKRASSFIKNMDQFKHTLTHLRTAQLRCEQLAILKVLNLYIERVPQSELNKFKDHVIVDDVGIIDGLIQLKEQPSSIHEHAFLHRVNSMGDSILSFQPTKITCAYLSLEYTKPKFEMWIDFNLKDKSIVFVAQPLTNDANQCIAIVTDPQLKECVINGEQLIIVKGVWSIYMVAEVSQLGINFSVTIFFPTHVLNMILESQVRSVFIESNTNFSSNESSSKDVHSKQMNSKRKNRNVFLPPPSYFINERISDAPSGRSQHAGSLESSILLLSSNQSVMDWKKSSCERLSIDGQQNRKLLLRGTDLEDDLIRDDTENECIKDTAMMLQIVQKYEKLSTNRDRKNDAEITKGSLVIHQVLGDDLERSDVPLCSAISVQEENMDDKFQNLIKKDHPADRFGELVKDEGKAENIKDTVTEEKIVEDNEKSSTNQCRKEDDQITKGPLVIPFALHDDYQSSRLSFRDNMPHEEFADDDIDNVHNKSVSGKDYFATLNICSVPQNPLIEEIDPLRNRNENIKVLDMSKALQQLRIDYDSSESFCDNQSVKEAYENLLKNDHLTDNEQVLTSTPRRYYNTKNKTSRATSFNERKESNVKLSENSLNDTNQLPKIDNTQYFQPLISVASDNLSIVDENHFVSSNLIQNHYRNENGNADSSLIFPPLMYQTVAINASEQREIFPNLNVSHAEMVQNTVLDIATKTVEYEFANEEELQKASCFYIDNSGLDYLNSTSFKRLNRREQKTKEQQLRASHDLMNRDLEALHPNRNDGKPHDDPYAFLLRGRSISKRKSNSKKVAGNKLNSYEWLFPTSSKPSRESKKTATKKAVFEFLKQKRGKSDETNKAMTTTRTTTPRRIRDISLLSEHETAPKLKKSENVDKIMPAAKRNTSNKRTTPSTTLQTFTINNKLADSTAVGKENQKSSIPNYSAKKPKIEILSVVDLVLHHSSEIMKQRDD